jgi:DNA mismatch repair ATPase MutS
MEVNQFYESRKSTLTEELKQLQSRKTTFAMLRLGSIIAIVACFYFLWSIGKIYAVLAAIVLLAIFIQLIYKDLANRAAIKHLQFLIAINEDELKALNGNYYHFAAGTQFIPHDHFYANDMDIFGRASLYQFLNRTTSELGAEKLATWLLNPAIPKTIIERQGAVKELKTLPEWRQNVEALGKDSSIKKNTLLQIVKWLKEPYLFIQFKHWQWLRFLLPAIILSITACYIFYVITEGTWYAALFVFAAVAFQINKVVAPLHNKLSSMVDDLNILSQSIAAIEKQDFVSPLLQQLQANLKTKNIVASDKIKKLKKILDRLDLRYNIVMAVPLNILLQWNLQQVLDLEKWKKENDENVQSWFDTLAEFEALNSLAILHFNNPDYCFPILSENHFSIAAKELGHPLIHQNKRINNFINIETAGEIMLVTGSNMAGKSTYLRSIGINVILTMAGAPVCATAFKISPVQLLSSMRIADNLEESTSTFYAELKKLKTVIEKINAGEKVFVLLDEILRGTNSLDRHTGSEALIRQLIKQKAAAILATHDVALAALDKEYPNNILNFHFDAQTKGEELFFDYKLKEGVCTNMNASLLMKKIGLEIPQGS